MIGDSSIKGAGTRYLARLEDQREDDFAEYVKRGFFL